MKKIVSLVIAIMLLLSFTACGTSPQTDSLTPGTTEDTSKNPTENSGINIPSLNDGLQKATIEETVLLDEADVKITAKSLDTDSLFGPELKLLIENNSGVDLTVQTRNSSVNGYMVDTLFSEDVVSGKKANCSISFLQSDLDACGIETISDIEFSFHIFTTSDWETYHDSQVIQLKTSAAEGYSYTFDDSGEIVYDQNDIKIVVKGLDKDDILGESIVVYIENNRQENITVQTRDVSVNGFMISALFSSEIVSQKHCVDTITFLSSDLEDNGITQIQSVELSFNIFESSSWDDIANTDALTINF